MFAKNIFAMEEDVEREQVQDSCKFFASRTQEQLQAFHNFVNSQHCMAKFWHGPKWNYISLQLNATGLKCSLLTHFNKIK